MDTIGEFAKRSHVSARMLRHYDAIGLLRPAHVAPSGYRYYDAAQLPVLTRIETLKGYGFTLAQIAELLPLPEEALARRIHARRIAAYEELAGLREALRRMEADIRRMEGNTMVPERYHIIMMQNPAQRVFGIRRTICIGEMHAVFDELYREMEKRGLTRAGATQSVFHGETYSYEQMDVEAQAEVLGDDPDVQILPACTCVCTTHIGPYSELKYAYEAIGGWLAAHPAYTVCGPAIERYLKDEQTACSPEEMETGVLVPVVKRDSGDA